MNESEYIRWALELCNQEGFKNPAELTREYNIEVLGC